MWALPKKHFPVSRVRKIQLGSAHFVPVRNKFNPLISLRWILKTLYIGLIECKYANYTTYILRGCEGYVQAKIVYHRLVMIKLIQVGFYTASYNIESHLSYTAGKRKKLVSIRTGLLGKPLVCKFCPHNSSVEASFHEFNKLLADLTSQATGNTTVRSPAEPYGEYEKL